MYFSIIFSELEKILEFLDLFVDCLDFSRALPFRLIQQRDSLAWLLMNILFLRLDLLFCLGH